MDYNEFELQDYLNNDSFVEWIRLGKENGHWQQVQENYPASRSVIKQAREIILQLGVTEDKQVSIDEEKVLSLILADIASDVKAYQSSSERFYSLKWIRWAAVVLFFVGTSWYFINKNMAQGINYNDLISKATKLNTLIEKCNTTDLPMRIDLEDGTVVILGKNSKISYPIHFTQNTRETFLSGEAFFEVAKNPSKPFFVYANEVVTQVLGTSFDVKAFDGESEIRVNVRNGQVSVYNQKKIIRPEEETKGLVLLPNQQAVFDRKNESLLKHLSDNPLPLQEQASEHKKLIEDTPVSEVFKKLEETYGIKIFYNKDIVKNCIISTRFGNESLKDKLDVVCQTINASYKEIDAQIIIESIGCQ